MDVGKNTIIPSDYINLLTNIKKRVMKSQVKAGLSVNQELVLLYWHIGKKLVEKQERSGWGSKVIERLSNDLQRSYPDMKGFSTRNLFHMRSFAQTYPNKEIVKQLASQIPWYHNIRLLQLIKDEEKRLWYIQKTIENGWSRNVLVHQIESDLYNRQGRALTNFENTLPAPQSDLAKQMLKDPYIFDFLTLEDKVVERQLERALVKHIRDFLLELGVGFAFVGSQYHLEVGDDDFYIDLLFYHLKLRSYVVIDLKVGEFKPEYAGKMNFYLSAVDDILRNETDNPSIGIVLCKGRKKLNVEYALRDIGKPIGVPTYKLDMITKLPLDLEGKLPTVEELEAELADAELAAGEPEYEEAED